MLSSSSDAEALASGHMKIRTRGTDQIGSTVELNIDRHEGQTKCITCDRHMQCRPVALLCCVICMELLRRAVVH